MVPTPVVLLPVAVPAFCADELHVNGTPVMELLLASMTVGVTVFDPDPTTVNELPLTPLMAREIDVTGHV
jgi:hypothetical protein